MVKETLVPYSQRKPKHVLRILGIFFLCICAACSGANKNITANASPNHQPDDSSPGEILPTETEISSSGKTPLDQTLEADAARQVTTFLGDADPAANPKPLIIGDQWFSVEPRSDNRLLFTFIVTNPNSDWGFKSIPFSVSYSDKSGKKLEIPFNENLGPLFPGQTVAFSNGYSIPENFEVDKVEIQMGKLEANKPGEQPFPLSVDLVKLVTYDDRKLVTGIIKNSYKNDIHWIETGVLAYDANNKLIGAGDGVNYVTFVPGNGQIAATFSLKTDEQPARVEIIPRFSIGSQIEQPSDETKDIQISGFGVRVGRANSVEYTAIFENNNPKKVYPYLEYSFAIYAEDGSVVAAINNSYRSLFPKDRVAVMGSFTLPADTRVARADVQFNYPENYDGDPNSMAFKLTANPLTASPKVIITEDKNYYTFSGTVSNSMDSEISGVEVIAVAFDSQEKIIGSAISYIDTLPPKGSAKVEVKLRKPSDKPAKVILYPKLP